MVFVAKRELCFTGVLCLFNSLHIPVAQSLFNRLIVVVLISPTCVSITLPQRKPCHPHTRSQGTDGGHSGRSLLGINIVKYQHLQTVASLEEAPKALIR